MKNRTVLILSFVLLCFVGCNTAKKSFTSTETDNQNAVTTSNQDTITITGFFDGKFHQKRGYKINDYYIRLGDITEEQLQLFTRKYIVVTGTLLNPEKEEKGFQSTNDKIQFIYNPVITLQ